MKRTQKIASVLIAVLMLVTLFGCAKPAAPTVTEAPAAATAAPVVTEAPAASEAPAAPAAGPTMSKIKSNGKLILGTSADYPPYEFHASIDGKDTIVGFDIEVGKAIAKQLGVELEIQDMAFDGLLAALSAGSIDLVIAGMTPDEERKQSVDFSDIYYYAVQGVLVRTEDFDKYKTVESLKGKKVGVQKGTVQEKIGNEQLTGAEILGLTKIQPLVLELKTKKLDAVVMEKPVAEAYVRQFADLKVSDIPVKDDQGGSAIAVTKGNEDLLVIINGVLKTLIDGGSIEKFVGEANILADAQAE